MKNGNKRFDILLIHARDFDRERLFFRTHTLSLSVTLSHFKWLIVYHVKIMKRENMATDYFQFSGKYGVAQPWYFPLSPKYWCSCLFFRSQPQPSPPSIQDDGEYLCVCWCCLYMCRWCKVACIHIYLYV